jgi:hypothetical protein
MLKKIQSYLFHFKNPKMLLVLVTAIYQDNLSLVEMISVACYASKDIMLIINSINIEP